MNLKLSGILTAFLVASPIALIAFSTGPPAKRTGNPIDGGLTCTACHADQGAANSDPRGSVAISAATYTPGVKQTIKVTVAHPTASRWGFQITARLISDPSKQAGAFTVNDTVRVRCDTVPAQDAPCNGANEFPEHNNAPITAAGAGYTFTVDWTPPATDVGDVVFYAAGNAANNDKNLTGDHIYTARKVISPQCGLSAKPTISAISNAASFQNSLAGNTLVTIFGTNLARAPRLAGSDDIVANGNSFPKQLACLAVEVDGVRAPLTYAQGNQVNLQIPSTSKLGQVMVKVIANPDATTPLSSDLSPITLTAAGPAFFTFSDGKSIAAQFAGTANILANPSLVSGARAAKAGDIVTLYGTGFGPTTPAVAAGDLDSGQANLVGPASVTVGGTALAASDILYIGLSPGSISGLFQVNIRIPATAPNGNVPVSIQVGGVKTQDGATIAVQN